MQSVHYLLFFELLITGYTFDAKKILAKVINSFNRILLFAEDNM